MIKPKLVNILFRQHLQEVLNLCNLKDKNCDDVFILASDLADKKTGHLTLDNLLEITNKILEKSSPMITQTYVVNALFSRCQRAIFLEEEVNRTDGDSHITINCNMKECTFYDQNELYKCCGATSCGHYEKKIPIEIL